MTDWQPTATFDALRLRAGFNRLVREFFHARDVLEVETPAMSLAGNSTILMSARPAPMLMIELFTTITPPGLIRETNLS